MTVGELKELLSCCTDDGDQVLVRDRYHDTDNLPVGSGVVEIRVEDDREYRSVIKLEVG